jgi:hypothetical protein
MLALQVRAISDITAFSPNSRDVPPPSRPSPIRIIRRFGVTYWSFTLTATDANRWAIRLARQLTGRSKSR